MLAPRTKLRKLRARLRYHVRIVLACLWRRLMFRTTVVAISGSVGKTTAKNCVAAVVGAHGPTVQTRNNENDQFGVPKTLLKIRPWHRYAVVEVGIADTGQMAKVARWIKPDIAILLAVARTHSNNMPTLDIVAREKKQLALAVDKKGLVLLNADDEHVRAMAGECEATVKLFGTSEDADFIASEVTSEWPARLSLNLHTSSGKTPIQTRLVGTHWQNSVMAALSVAQVLNLPVDSVAEAIETVEPFRGRMQPLTIPNGATVIGDEGGGTPDALSRDVEGLRRGPRAAQGAGVERSLRLETETAQAAGHHGGVSRPSTPTSPSSRATAVITPRIARSAKAWIRPMSSPTMTWNTSPSTSRRTRGRATSSSSRAAPPITSRA